MSNPIYDDLSFYASGYSGGSALSGPPGDVGINYWIAIGDKP
jgi:hypothetical protein